MTESSPTWVDVKVKLEGQLLVHLELRGYRSDKDMAIQLWHITDAIHTILNDTVFIPSIVVTVFQGWRVIACSWEVGGRLYACSEGFSLLWKTPQVSTFVQATRAFAVDLDQCYFGAPSIKPTRFLVSREALQVGSPLSRRSSPCEVERSGLVSLL